MNEQQRAVIKQAIEFVKDIQRGKYKGDAEEVSVALSQLLEAAPVQEPESFEQWNAKQHGDPEEIGFLQALRIAYCAGQDSVAKTTPPAAQPAAWVGLTAEEIMSAPENLIACIAYVQSTLRKKNGGKV